MGLRVADLVGDFSKFTAKFQFLVAEYKKRYPIFNQNRIFLMNHRFPTLEVDVDAEIARYKEFGTILFLIGSRSDAICS